MASKAAKEITARLKNAGSKEQAKVLSRFFKCAPGCYGEGDKFLGVKVPVTRSMVKEALPCMTLTDVRELLASEWHEVRLAGFLTLVEFYRKAEKRKEEKSCEEITDFYLDSLEKCNNWDLVDLSAPHILGKQALIDERALCKIYNLSDDSRLWHRRVGVVATMTLIKNGRCDIIYEIAPRQFEYQHDLIRKATGWMLREAGKIDKEKLIQFLEENEKIMPRTTYRYATEIINRKAVD
ncbi:MAG: DNA alkylation repair protein [Paramuribaculum sp.]|nr:DNA alkylation repair protein [Paramuribaculum sp.]